MSAGSTSSVDLVLFDLGGVLVELRGVSAMQRLSGISDEGELWDRWLTCRWVSAFESGACTTDQFARGVVEEWELSVDPVAFLEEFRTWPVGPFPGAEQLVREVRAAAAVACFTNTNRLHWEGNAADWSLVRLFGQRFVSFEMGLAKPDPDAFEWVVGHLSRPPTRVLFLDDNEVNVEVSRAFGFQAERVRGVMEARVALVRAGVLEGG